MPAGVGRYRLEGAKTFASGAGHVARPPITGALPDGGWQMCVVPLERARVAIDPSWWQPLGMRASASYRVGFGGVELDAGALVRAPVPGSGRSVCVMAPVSGHKALLEDMCLRILHLDPVFQILAVVPEPLPANKWNGRWPVGET